MSLEKIIKIIESSDSWSDISKKAGISHQAIRKKLKKAGKKVVSNSRFEVVDENRR